MASSEFFPSIGDRVAVRPYGWDPASQSRTRAPHRDYDGTVVAQEITGAYRIADPAGVERSHMIGDLQPLATSPADHSHDGERAAAREEPAR